jgi:phosphoribosyl 1,2-cyclic phosphodiesterase
MLSLLYFPETAIYKGKTVLRFSLLSSGSAGNAILIVSGQHKILIDNGLSYKELCARAAEIGEDLTNLLGILVTHEHGDHVNGLGVLSRKQCVTTYITRPTFQALHPRIGKIEPVEHFDSGDTILIGPFKITSFRISHDAMDPVSFVVEAHGCRLGLATDLGKATHLVRERLEGCHALVLESNYCPLMIRNSPYPAQIIQRIRSNQGHLSNADMNSLLADLIHEQLQWVVAVHVSQENNSEDLVRRMAQQVLKEHPAQLIIADQVRPSPMYTILPQALEANSA